MKYYAIYNTKTQQLSKAQCRCLNAEVENIEISKEIYEEFDKYIYQDGEIILDTEYELKKQAKEAEQIAMLKLTRGDVFRGLLQAKGITRNQIRALIEAMPETTDYERITKELALIDFDEALDFYRGNTLIDTLGEELGISKSQLDEFFKTNDYNSLILLSEEEVPF